MAHGFSLGGHASYFIRSTTSTGLLIDINATSVAIHHRDPDNVPDFSARMIRGYATAPRSPHTPISAYRIQSEPLDPFQLRNVATPKQAIIENQDQQIIPNNGDTSES